MASARISITVADDRLSATANIEPGSPATHKDLLQAIAKAGVRFGVKEEFCHELGIQLADRSFTGTDLKVAIGNPGERGRDGSVELELAESEKRQRRRDGTLNHRERSKIHTAALDAHFATYNFPTKGKSGTTVTGVELERPDGQDRLPEFGPGVNYDEEIGDITAAIPGLVCCVQGRSVNVTDLCTHKGDVNYESGNLHVDGSLRVEGNLQSNFELTAGGNVIIDGQYCSGTVYSESNIYIAGGVTGGDQPGKLEGPSDVVVCAAGDITCRHANGATLTAGATISFADHCISSWVTARDIELLEGRGKIVGGELQATHSIRVTEAGSPSEQRTMLAVGFLSEDDGDDSAIGINAGEVIITGTAHPGVIIRIGSYVYNVTIPVQSVHFTFNREELCVQMQVLEPHTAAALA